MAEIDVKEFVKPTPKKRIKKIKGDSNPIIGILIILMVVGVVVSAEWYADWRAEHQWQVPIVFRSPIKLVERTLLNPITGVVEVKVLTDVETMEQYQLSPVLKTVYFLESTSGKNDSCKDQGKFNGFGYRQNSFESKCYDSFAQVADKVNEWYEDRLSTNGNNLVEAICFYNKGIQGLSVCDYSENFMGVLTKNF
jgi:hypothetical protein